MEKTQDVHKDLLKFKKTLFGLFNVMAESARELLSFEKSRKNVFAI